MKESIEKSLKKIYRNIPFKDSTKKKIKSLILNQEKNKLDKNKTLKKLLKYDIISFDIFDTLITRLLFEPDDLFIMIGEKIDDQSFLTKRKEAEQEAIKNLNKDVNIDEIYDYFKKINKISDKKVQEIKQLEISLELALIVPRLDMLNIIKDLKNQNKTIIFTSDMYLTKDTIIKMLEKCQYTSDMYDAIYLSNEINKRKDRKDIWPYLKNIYNKKRIIHIGDNIKSDYLYPKEFKIDSIKIDSSKELFFKSNIYPSLKEFIDKRTVSDSIYLGLILNKKIFNSPFSNLQINDLNDFGYVFHAPILFQFIKYIENIEEDKILFLAREGYFLQKLYQDYNSLFKMQEKSNYYFLASRKATSTATIEDKAGVFELTNKYFDGTIKDFFSQIFGIDYKGDNFYINLPNDKEKVDKEVEKCIVQIENTIKEEKENYISYIKNLIKDYEKSNLALIDLGYSGTIQYNLTKMLNKEFTGYYLTNSESVKHYSKKSKLKFLFDINENEEYKKIFHYSLILEFFLSAPYGQLQKFIKENKKVVPVYNDERLDEKKEKSLNILYESVLEYMNDILNISKVYNYNPQKQLLCREYIALVESNIISIKVKDCFDFVDAFNSSGTKNVFKIISRY